MIAVNAKIVKIDYEKTFRQLFPILKEKLAAMDSRNMLLRLFQKLDDAALPVLLGIMGSLQENTKNELLVSCINAYSVRLRDMLNQQMLRHPYGKYLHAGAISGAREGKTLQLWIGQIQVDYKGLVRDNIPGALGGIASVFVGNKLENMALELLWTDESRQKLTELATSALVQYGFAIELAEIQMVQDFKESNDAIELEGHLELTAEMEEDILDALAAALRSVCI